MREVTGLLFGVLLCIVAIMIGSTLATKAWQADPEDGPVRTVGIEEYRHGQGKPSVTCPNCGPCVLTDWWQSPCVYGRNGWYKGRVKGNRFIFDTPPTMDNLFQKGKP